MKTAPTVTLRPSVHRAGRRMAKGEYVMGYHDRTSHLHGQPCIHIRRAAEYQTIPLIVLESVHHALFELDETIDDAWENYHGLFFAACRRLNLF